MENNPLVEQLDQLKKQVEEDYQSVLNNLDAVYNKLYADIKAAHDKNREQIDATYIPFLKNLEQMKHDLKI